MVDIRTLWKGSDKQFGWYHLITKEFPGDLKINSAFLRKILQFYGFSKEFKKTSQVYDITNNVIHFSHLVTYVVADDLAPNWFQVICIHQALSLPCTIITNF